MIEWIKNNKKHLFIFFYFIIISGLIGIFVVQAPNYDFYSYHYHNGWAFINNRIDTDFLPAIFRSYFNPVFDAINYILISKLQTHPNIFLFISNIKFGFFLFMTYLIANLTFANQKSKDTCIISSIVLTILSPIVIFAVRFDNNDLICANLALISLYLFLKFIFLKNSPKRLPALFLSTLILSAAIGLKYTTGVYAIPMIISCLIFYKKIPQLWKTFWTMLGGGIFGFLITDGWWMYTLWKHFKNPLFPYMNNYFKSPVADTQSVMSTDFGYLKYNSFLEYFLSPLKNSYTNLFVGMEAKYYEPKLPLAFIILLISGILLLFKKFRHKLGQITNFNLLIILILFTIIPYYINLTIFGNIRYVVLSFALISIIITAIATMLEIKIKDKKIYPLLIIILILNLLFIRFIQSDFIIKKGNIISIEDAHIENNSTVLVAGAISSFVIPGQNSKAKYTAFCFPKDLQKYYKNIFKKNPNMQNHFYFSETLKKKNSEIFQSSKNIYLIINNSDYQIMPKAYDDAIKIYTKGEINELRNCKNINYNLFNSFSDIQYKICKIK